MIDTDKLYKMNTEVQKAFQKAVDIPTRENIDRYHELEDEYATAKRMSKNGNKKPLQR